LISASSESLTAAHSDAIAERPQLLPDHDIHFRTLGHLLS
jgi:hypothetical protein